ncbi:MAG: hypothetical protein O2971_09310 [Proteobacteria bacterium]|nr:hypothetical protein [Pseudomonadota bacterium]
MHAQLLLHELLRKICPTIHAKRLNTLLAAVQTLSAGAKATVTSLGRGLAGETYDKHKIKRIDRLLSNGHLYQECHLIYKNLTQLVLRGLTEVIVVIDWSPLCADQSWQLLRARFL